MASEGGKIEPSSVMAAMVEDRPWRTPCRPGATSVSPRPQPFPGVNEHSRRAAAFAGENRDTCRNVCAEPEYAMIKVAVIEDDVPTSNQLKEWILSARPGIAVDQWFSRDDAEAAIGREEYDVVVLDIELGRERHAGVAIINAINKAGRGTPVLVVSAMPAAIYRSIMKALDAWDYLQKTTFEEGDFIDTFLEILRASRDRENG